jgi:hypothetical protein
MHSLAIRAETDDEQAALSRQLSVIPEMLATLDTLTAAGQHHILGKVVTFIEDQVRHAIPRVGRRNQATLVELMEHLKRESHRLLPDLARVNQHATTLMTLIAAVQ